MDFDENLSFSRQVSRASANKVVLDTESPPGGIATKIHFFIESGPNRISAITSFCSSSVPSAAPIAQASRK